MTFEEAKKILEKEFAVIDLHKSTEPFEFDESRWFENEKPAVLEAFRVLAKEGYYITISGHDYDMRKKRLEKEYEQNTKSPGPGEEQPKEKKGIIYPSTSPKADFYYKHVLNEGNPALKEAASQFNDALLDEQGKKIKHLTKKISRLNKIIHKKNKELRLTKIREKNLAELGLKYVGENEKLKKKLADKIVDKIDVQALKSAESALAWKEKKIAEKDEVIADLGNELAATKKELEEKTKLVEVVRRGSKEYCEYGIAAEKMIQKMADVIVYDRPVFSKDFEQYRLWANGYRFNPQLPEIGEEEEKKLEHAKKIRVSSDNAEEGADLYGVIVLCGKDFIDALKNVKEVWQE